MPVNAVHRGIVLLMLAAASVAADDWPCYQKDARRSSVTRERLRLPLKCLWRYESASRPSPAWLDPGRAAALLDFDHCYYPVATRGLVYFASSSDDTLYCLEAATGKTRWRFTADAPLRFAPHVAGRRCYVGGDDGIVYCLDAASGRELWQFDGRPSNRMLPGNGRMISRWPCRTGVLVANGLVYFACGIWPSQGVRVYAIDADTGELVWCNDTSSSMYLAFPHDGVSFGGPVPQGYLLADQGRLVVPTGQSSPAFFDASNGRFIAWSSRAPGSTWMTIADQRVIVSARGWIGDQDVRLGEAPVWESDGLGFLDVETGEGLAGDWRGYNRLPTSARARLKGRMRGQIDPIGGRYRCVVDGPRSFFAGMGTVERVDMVAKSPRCVWQIDHPRAYAMVLTGSTLLLGSAGRIAAVNPRDGATVWSAALDGQARGIAVADGAVLVSTHNGTIYAFTAEATGAPVVRSAPRRQGGREPTPFAGGIVPRDAKGYALLVGEKGIGEARTLAHSSRLKVICLFEDRNELRRAREALLDLGLAEQVKAHLVPGNGLLPYSDYFASMVVVGKHATSVQPSELYRVLSPRTGKMLFPGSSRSALARLLGEAGVDPAEVHESDGLTFVSRSPLRGAFDWDSTGTRADQRVKWPLELLWFGGPGRSRMLARHRQYGHSGTPIPAGGRYTCWAERHVICVDAYNGTELWSHEIPGYHTVAGDDQFIYVGKSGHILCLDAASGRLAKVYGSRARPFVRSLERPAQFRARKESGHSGSITLRRTRSGLLVTLVTSTPQPDPHDAWTLHFDFRAADERLLPFSRGAFPLVVGANGAAVRRFDGFDDSIVVPRVEVRKNASGGIDIRLPFSGIEKLVGNVPDHFDMRARVMLFQGDRTWLNALPFTDGRDLMGNGTMTFALNAGASDSMSPSTLVEFLPRSAAPRHAKGIGKLPPLLRLDGNKGHKSLAASFNEDFRWRKNPLTQKVEEVTYVRGYGCGGVISSATMDFFRSGTFGMYDVADDSGMRNFPGLKPGCRISILPAMGIVISSEANADCLCPYSLAASMALAPTKTRRNEDWALFYHRMSEAPIEQIALNLGAPGDRRDATGRVWLGYPRSSAMLQTGGCFGPVGHAFGLPVALELLDGSGVLRVNTDRVQIANTRTPWISGSAVRGIKKLSVDLTYTEPRTTCLAVAAGEPIEIDGKLIEGSWSKIPGLPLKLSPDDTRSLGQAGIRFNDREFYFGYKQRAKIDRRGKPVPWPPASQGNIWGGGHFDVVLRDASRPAFLHVGIGLGGHRYGVVKSFVAELPKIDPVQADGRDSEWSGGATYVLPKEAGSIRLAWTSRGVAILSKLPRSFSLGDAKRTALRLQLFDVSSASVAELAIEPEHGTAQLIKPKISRPHSRDFRAYEDESPLAGDVSVSKSDERVLVEAVVPFDAFGGENVAGRFLGLALVAYDPGSGDHNISRGKGARRSIFHEPALMGVSFSGKRFSREYRVYTPRRVWYGTIVHFAPTERKLPAPLWNAAIRDSSELLSAEMAVPRSLLREAGISEQNMMMKFMNRARLHDDAFVAVRSSGFRRVYPQPSSRDKSKRYRLVLHFAELSDAEPGDRVFDISVQGQRVVGDFDIAREAGGRYRAVTREVRGVEADASIRVEFQPRTGKLPPILNGIEIHAD